MMVLKFFAMLRADFCFKFAMVCVQYVKYSGSFLEPLEVFKNKECGPGDQTSLTSRFVGTK